MTTNEEPRQGNRADHRVKLIEVALPLEAINAAAGREKYLHRGHPSTMHTWWSRKPLAACRAVLFAQLVDDPSAWPEQFPTEEAQRSERERLFEVIRRMVPWEATDDEQVWDAARREVAHSLARARREDGIAAAEEGAILAGTASQQEVRSYLGRVALPIHDPFAGGGSIPLEAQRLGVPAVASDLNPVAVLLDRALIELPARFAGRSPVGPLGGDSGQRTLGAEQNHWPGATGLAEDVRRWSAWMHERARERLGSCYPRVELPHELGGGSAQVVAWLWARTVASPDPAHHGIHVPLLSTFYLSKREGREVWLEPQVEPRGYRFHVRTGPPDNHESVSAGTSLGRGVFRCLLSGTPIRPDHVKSEGRARRLGQRLIAVVVDAGQRGRLYLPGDSVPPIDVTAPEGVLDTEFPARALGFRIQAYGLTRHRDLYTPRQLLTLSTLTDLLGEVRGLVVDSAVAAGHPADDRPLAEGGRGAVAYAEAVVTYLALGVSRYSNACTTLCTWNPGQESVRFTFVRQALPMSWEFAELDPFGPGSGAFGQTVAQWVAGPLASLPTNDGGDAFQLSAQRLPERKKTPRAFSFDPPFFDSIAYADLSDVFYVWLRRGLRSIHPDLFRTLLTPKEEELVADPFRRGGREQARRYFVEGMTQALVALRGEASPQYPLTIYYAFKQTETEGEEASSTGWETFLEALTRAGLGVTATWPIRTEMTTRSRSLGSNALASSVVIACRPTPQDRPTISRRDFRRLLRQDLPRSVRALLQGNIAPVDMAQAVIGPGMAIFARYAQVLEADGSPLTVRGILGLINEILDEHLTEGESDLDPDSRFAITWFETHRFEPGDYGDAENLARAKALAVSGIEEAGLIEAVAGKVRLLRRDELPRGWVPSRDTRPTLWEATQHLIKRLEEQGEEPAAQLLAALGDRAAAARELAYRLYVSCERSRWAEDARAYNGLVQTWPELERLAATLAGSGATSPQQQLFRGA